MVSAFFRQQGLRPEDKVPAFPPEPDVKIAAGHKIYNGFFGPVCQVFKGLEVGSHVGEEHGHSLIVTLDGIADQQVFRSLIREEPCIQDQAAVDAILPLIRDVLQKRPQPLLQHGLLHSLTISLSHLPE